MKKTIVNASEMRAIAKDVFIENNAELIDRVIEAIKCSSIQGLNQTMLDGTIDPMLKYVLEENGYKIKQLAGNFKENKQPQYCIYIA